VNTSIDVANGKTKGNHVEVMNAPTPVPKLNWVVIKPGYAVGFVEINGKRETCNALSAGEVVKWWLSLWAPTKEKLNEN